MTGTRLDATAATALANENRELRESMAHLRSKYEDLMAYMKERCYADDGAAVIHCMPPPAPRTTLQPAAGLCGSCAPVQRCAIPARSAFCTRHMSTTALTGALRLHMCDLDRRTCAPPDVIGSAQGSGIST